MTVRRWDDGWMEPWSPCLSGVVTLPSGRLVRGRALRDGPVGDDDQPEFGLYLTARPHTESWTSQWIAWPDFRLPRATSDAVSALREAYEHTHAEILLADPALDVVDHETITIVERTVGELGLLTGGTLPEVFERAEAVGLRLCPPITAAYLRLALADQTSAPDSVLSTGRAPSGSITVAARRLCNDDDYPAGFYLRVIDGRPWLRGYRCDDEHAWSTEDRFVFQTTS